MGEKVTDQEHLNEKKEMENEKSSEEDNSSEKWRTVKHSKKFNNPVENVKETKINSDTDEMVLAKHKQSGHKRLNPQSPPKVQTEKTITINQGLVCEVCSETFNDLNTAKDHTKIHKKQNKYDNCEICQEDFETQAEFERHMKDQHSKQWNCEECDFQASSRNILMNHCKLSPGHHPSKGQKQRLGQTGVLECYTCQHEFRSYHDLMNHRKEEHPSHKKCRYFIKGTCHFSGDECWYIHEDTVDTSEVEIEGGETCFVCKQIFPTKHDMMEHKKKNHPSKVLCKNFMKVICERSAAECWYLHKRTTKENITIPTPNSWGKPVPHLQKQVFPQASLMTPPDQTSLVIALNMLNQKMDMVNSLSQRLQTMENLMFPKPI